MLTESLHRYSELLALCYRWGLPWLLSWERICLQCRKPWFNSWIGKICWKRDRLPTPVFLDFPAGSAGKESACNAGDQASIPGLGRSPREGKGYPLQCFALGNSKDCIVQGGHRGGHSWATFTFTLAVKVQHTVQQFHCQISTQEKHKSTCWHKCMEANAWSSIRHKILNLETIQAFISW